MKIITLTLLLTLVFLYSVIAKDRYPRTLNRFMNGQKIRNMVNENNKRKGIEFNSTQTIKIMDTKIYRNKNMKQLFFAQPVLLLAADTTEPFDFIQQIISSKNDSYHQEFHDANQYDNNTFCNGAFKLKPTRTYMHIDNYMVLRTFVRLGYGSRYISFFATHCLKW